MSAEQNEVLMCFFDEVIDLLPKWESAVLKLEEKYDVKVVNELFRIAHNIKGSSKMVELHQLSEFIHEVENVITFLRDNEFCFNLEYVDFFLNAHSILIEWIEKLPTNFTYVCDTTGAVATAQKLISQHSTFYEKEISENLVIVNLKNIILNNKFDKTEKTKLKINSNKIDTAGIQYLISLKKTFPNLYISINNESLRESIRLLGAEGLIL